MVLEKVEEEAGEAEEDSAAVEDDGLSVRGGRCLLVFALDVVWLFLINHACLVFTRDARSAALS